MKSKNIIIIILSILVVCLSGYIVYDKVLVNKDDKNNENGNDKQQTVVENKYKQYRAGDTVKLKNNTEWIVLTDSGNDMDYVTILSRTQFDIDSNYYDELSNEYYNRSDDWEFSNSKMYNYLKIIQKDIPADFKKIDGYEIRLISVDEIIKMDNLFQYNSETGSYNYQGDNVNKDLIGLSTMDKAKCGMGKCAQYYTTGSAVDYSSCSGDSDCNKSRYFISTWSVGLANPTPVINVYKSSIVE